MVGKKASRDARNAKIRENQRQKALDKAAYGPSTFFQRQKAALKKKQEKENKFPSSKPSKVTGNKRSYADWWESRPKAGQTRTFEAKTPLVANPPKEEKQSCPDPAVPKEEPRGADNQHLATQQTTKKIDQPAQPSKSAPTYLEAAVSKGKEPAPPEIEGGEGQMPATSAHSSSGAREPAGTGRKRTRRAGKKNKRGSKPSSVQNEDPVERVDPLDALLRAHPEALGPQAMGVTVRSDSFIVATQDINHVYSEYSSVLETRGNKVTIRIKVKGVNYVYILPAASFGCWVVVEQATRPPWCLMRKGDHNLGNGSFYCQGNRLHSEVLMKVLSVKALYTADLRSDKTVRAMISNEVTKSLGQPQKDSMAAHDLLTSQLQEEFEQCKVGIAEGRLDSIKDRATIDEALQAATSSGYGTTTNPVPGSTLMDTIQGILNNPAVKVLAIAGAGALAIAVMSAAPADMKPMIGVTVAATTAALAAGDSTPLVHWIAKVAKASPNSALSRVLAFLKGPDAALITKLLCAAAGALEELLPMPARILVILFEVLDDLTKGESLQTVLLNIAPHLACMAIGMYSLPLAILAHVLSNLAKVLWQEVEAAVEAALPTQGHKQAPGFLDKVAEFFKAPSKRRRSKLRKCRKVKVIDKPAPIFEEPPIDHKPDYEGEPYTVTHAGSPVTRDQIWDLALTDDQPLRIAQPPVIALGHHYPTVAADHPTNYLLAVEMRLCAPRLMDPYMPVDEHKANNWWQAYKMIDEWLVVPEVPFISLDQYLNKYMRGAKRKKYQKVAEAVRMCKPEAEKTTRIKVHVKRERLPPKKELNGHTKPRSINAPSPQNTLELLPQYKMAALKFNKALNERYASLLGMDVAMRCVSGLNVNATLDILADLRMQALGGVIGVAWSGDDSFLFYKNWCYGFDIRQMDRSQDWTNLEYLKMMHYRFGIDHELARNIRLSSQELSFKTMGEATKITLNNDNNKTGHPGTTVDNNFVSLALWTVIITTLVATTPNVEDVIACVVQAAGVLGFALTIEGFSDMPQNVTFLKHQWFLDDPSPYVVPHPERIFKMEPKGRSLDKYVMGLGHMSDSGKVRFAAAAIAHQYKYIPANTPLFGPLAAAYKALSGGVVMDDERCLEAEPDLEHKMWTGGSQIRVNREAVFTCYGAILGVDDSLIREADAVMDNILQIAEFRAPGDAFGIVSCHLQEFAMAVGAYPSQ